MKTLGKFTAVITMALMLMITGIVVCNADYENTADIFTLSIGSNSASVFGMPKESDVAPLIRNGRTMLPARFVAENFGATVSWDNDNQIVTIKTDKVEIKIKIGSLTATINGVEITLDSAAFVENGRTYTPVRFIAEALGSVVSWDNDTQTVIMSKPVKMVPLILKDLKIKYTAGGEMVQYNPGAIGGMDIGAFVLSPANVEDVLIATWSEIPFTPEEIEAQAKEMAEIWKTELGESISAPKPLEIIVNHPVFPEDVGKKMYVLIVGLDKDFNPVAYRIVEEVAGTNK